MRRHFKMYCEARGPPRRASAYEISKSTGFHVDFGFQNGFLDFKRISGFQSGFLDFAISEDTAKIYSWTIMNHIPLRLYADRIQCHRQWRSQDIADARAQHGHTTFGQNSA